MVGFIVWQHGRETRCHKVPADGQQVVQFCIALGVLIEDLFDKEKRVGVDADADRLEGNSVL